MNSQSPITYLLKSTPKTTLFTLPLYFTTHPIENDETDSVNSEDSLDPPLPPDTRSTLSKLSIDFHLFFDILSNKPLHSPFDSLVENTSWIFIDDESVQNGPFSSAQMNLLFQEDKLLESFRFKRNDEIQFLQFDQILKRYYKKMYPSKVSTQPPKVKQLEGVKDAFVGTLPEKKPNRNVRDLRILSDQVRPIFNFQTNTQKGEVETCEEEELFETRGRSITMS